MLISYISDKEANQLSSCPGAGIEGSNQLKFKQLDLVSNRFSEVETSVTAYHLARFVQNCSMMSLLKVQSALVVPQRC